MKTKIFTLLSLSILALVIMAGVVSAAITLTPDTYSTSIQQDASDSFTFVIHNDGAGGDYNLINISADVSDLTGSAGTISSDNVVISNLPTSVGDDEDSSDVTVKINIDEFQAAGVYTGTIEISGEHEGSTGSPDPKQISLTVTVTEKPRPEEVQECILTGNDAGADNDDLELKIKDISVVSGFGEDTDWFPFDKVEVEIEVKNDNNDYKMKDITIGWGLYDTETGDWYVDEEENDFNLKSDDKKTLTVSFELDEDIDELAEGDYVFYVWANAVLDADTEKDLCASVFEDEISIADENDFVILNNIQFPETASCGSPIQITANVWNIGDEDQEDVLVVIQSEELGITKKIVVGDIDAFEDEKIDVLLNIPQDAEEKSYLFSLKVFDEYGEVFENDNDDKAEFQVYLKVEGLCSSEPKVTVSASLESEAKAGEDLIIKVTVTNSGVKTGTFDVSLSDYSDWATLESVVPGTLTLNAGDSEDVIVTLKINSDVSGNKNFNVLVTEGTKVFSQPIAVMVEKQGGFGGITGGIISEGNWPIWVIGAVNVVLIFIIILVALKVAKK